MHLAYSIKIFPTQEQEDVLWNLSDRCRLLYNFALQEIGRDRNSAGNIMVRFLSHNATWSGCPGSGPLEGFLGNLRQTGLPIQPMKQAPAGMPHL